METNFPFSQRNYQLRQNTAAYSAVRYFQHVLEERTFFIQTDHKPLLGAFLSNSQNYAQRDTRHLDYMLQFTADIRYIKGTDNVPADTMFRCVNAPLLKPGLDYQSFMEEQAKDQ